MKDCKYGQIHLIPFDIGFMFYDVLTPSNESNKKFGQKFIERIQKQYPKQIFFVSDNQENNIGMANGKIDNFGAKELVCRVELLDNLYCYILNSGIAIFVLGDFEHKAINNIMDNSKNYELPVLMNVQKKITNEALMSWSPIEITDEETKKLLNRKHFKPKDLRRIYDKKINPLYANVLSKEIKTMHDFKDFCWESARNAAKEFKHEFRCVRPYTSSPAFKNYGFSYSMNIMISNELSNEGMEYLLNGGSPKLYFNNKDYWQTAENHYNDIKNSCKSEDNVVCAGPYEMHFSWSSIIVKTNQKIDSLKKFVDEQQLLTLLYAEMNIQARWFNADNCIDNSIENQYSKIENLQTLQSFIEYCSAEIENPTSSCFSSLYLKIRKQIVRTSKIQELYRSIRDKMKAQKEIKEGLLRKRTNKLILATDILLGCFAAVSVFKTIWDIATKDFKWWSLLILLATILLFVGIQIWIYEAKKKEKE